MLTILSDGYSSPFSCVEAANFSHEMEPAPMPMALPESAFHSLMSSPLRTSRQSLPEPTPATPTIDFAPWPRASVMSCGPKAVMSRSPEASAVRASAKRWNITGSICTLYLAAYSGSSQSGESAGTLSIPCLTLTGAGSGARTSDWANAAVVNAVTTTQANSDFFMSGSLPLQPAEPHALDDAAVGHEEDHQQRQRAERGAGHDGAVGLRAVGAAEQGQRHRQREHVGLVHRDQRPQEVVPRRAEREDGQRAEHRLRERQHDAQEDLPGAGAVDPRGVLQLARHGEEELAQEEDAEGERHRRLRHDQPLVGAEPAETLREHVLGHQHHGVGNHQAADQQAEDQVAAGKAHARQRIGRHGADEDHDQRGAHRDDRAVEERSPDARRARAAEEDLVIVLQRGRPRDPLGRRADDVGRLLERGHQHPERRRQPQHGQREHHRRERAPPHQYSVCPRSSRNCRSEKPTMTANSTQAMAEAEPKWKKFWKAVS